MPWILNKSRFKRFAHSFQHFEMSPASSTTAYYSFPTYNGGGPREGYMQVQAMGQMLYEVLTQQFVSC